MTAQPIPLTVRPASSCACCSPEPESPAEQGVGASAIETYGLLGLTCGGCAARVAAALKGLDGVLDAQVTAVPGGVSTAVVTAARPVSSSAVAEAVQRAGYRIADGRSPETGRGGCCSS
jgi:copper chaperone CopZ